MDEKGHARIFQGSKSRKKLRHRLLGGKIKRTSSPSVSHLSMSLRRCIDGLGSLRKKVHSHGINGVSKHLTYPEVQHLDQPFGDEGLLEAYYC